MERTRDPLTLARATISVALVFLIGCTTALRSDHAYAHRQSEPPLTLYWNYVRGPGILVAEGIARNELPRKFQFVDVRATLVGLDPTDRVIGRSVTRVPDFIGPQTPFRVDLRLSGAEHAFDLHFEYRTEDIETNGRH